MKLRRLFSGLLSMLLLLCPCSRVAQAQETIPQKTEASVQQPQDNEGFSCPQLQQPHAQSIYVVNLDDGTVVYTMQADTVRPMASLTKIMTFVVVTELVEDPENTWMSIPESVQTELEGTGSSLACIQTDEILSIEQLLHLMMVPSGNDAALALAKYIDSWAIPAEDPTFDENGDGVMSFVELMNRKAVELGCVNTHFMNPHGLHHEAHHTTAREIARITEYALTLPRFREITSQTAYTLPPTNQNENPRVVTATNRMMLPQEPYYCAYVDGIKTGSLNESGYCIAASGTNGVHRYLAVCMGSPMLDEDGAYIDYHGEMVDAAALLSWALETLDYRSIPATTQTLGSVWPLYSAQEKQIDYHIEDAATVLLPTDVPLEAVTMTVKLNTAVKAPLEKGDVIGTAVYTYGSHVLAQVPVKALAGAERVRREPKTPSPQQEMLWHWYRTALRHRAK